MATTLPAIHFRCRNHRNLHQRLWQVSAMNEGGLAGREVAGEHHSGLQPGGWVIETRKLDPGLYCQRCLDDGALVPMPDYDERDIEDAGLTDSPHIGLLAGEFDLNSTWERIQRRFADLIVSTRDREAVPATTDDRWKSDVRLCADLRAALDRKLSGRDLYDHQALAITAALDGRDVMIETATASGKSLCYWVPVLNTVLQDDRATALYLAPLNALAEDQLRALDSIGIDPAVHARSNTYSQYVRNIRIGSKSILAARYDGSIRDWDLRRTIRTSGPSILITNPDMLHYGILPHHGRIWQNFISNLKYIIVDELHVYKGMFGANCSNILRRLLRLTRHYGQRPQIIGCSASIGNPQDLFTSITGRHRPVLVPASASGAPSHLQRRAILDVGRSADAMSTIVKELMMHAVGEDKARTIAFMRSISEVDQVYRFVSGELGRRVKGISKNVVREYKREIPVDQKAQVTIDLRSGATLGVVSTTALQLGIDIGDLSVCIICKFPGSKAAFFQQAGRVGRMGESLVLFVADESPLDQHFVLRPEELLDSVSEVVYLNPDHPDIVLKHLKCAAEELRLDPNTDREFWGENITSLLDKLAAMEGMSRDGREVLVVRKPGAAAAEVDIRSLGFECVVRDEAGKEVARPDVLRAMRRFHKYARFQIQEQAYEVTRLAINWNSRKAEAIARKLARLEYSTASVVRTNCMVLDAADSLPLLNGIWAERGEVRFTVFVDAYYRIPAGAGEPEFQHLGTAAPPEHELETQGLWLTFGGEGLVDLDAADHIPSVRSAIESMRIAAALMCSTDPDDLGSHVEFDTATHKYRAFLVDNGAGGSGLTVHAFRNLDGLIDGALRILRDCPNCLSHSESRGCPRCVTTPWGDDEDVCRRGGVLLLERLRQTSI